MELFAIYLVVAVLVAGVMIGLENDERNMGLWLITGVIWPIYLLFMLTGLVGDMVRFARRRF